MQAETLFISAIASYLGTQGLTPTPKRIGAVEPAQNSELPAVVVSLEQVSRTGSGLGGRTKTMLGALPWKATINLASPYLPDDPIFSLVSPDRKVLTLPHGGLVKADGTTGALSSSDINVTLNGAAQTLVSGTPGAGQYRVDPTIGQLTFGTALPATGTIVANYFLGQWEQQVQRIGGVLRVDALATDGADSVGLSDKIIEALLASGARKSIVRLLAISLTSLGPVTSKESGYANARRRSARFAFDYEAELNAPESSGGIIGRIPITTHISSASVDEETGDIVETTETELDEV